MMPKFSSQDGDKALARLDRIAGFIQANYKSWTMPEQVAKEIVWNLDKTADEIEAQTFGPESLMQRQVEVVKQASSRRAEVVQRDPDEGYMDVFKNPMAPVQIESDEPYMKAYGPPDQSSAVLHGESTTGRPLTPHT